MDRREHLKLLLTGSIGTGLFAVSSCSEEDRKFSEKIIKENSYGRTKAEQERDEKLHENNFFTKEELRAVETLCDIVIPADEVSGSAADAGVPEFIEFMVKDLPYLQVPLRGGLMWLDNKCRQRYDKVFADCATQQQLELIDEFAYPDNAHPDMGYGVRFFNRMRNLITTGFFTSEVGLKDLGYEGNIPNAWDGVPEEVLRKHGLSYDKKTLDECIKPEERGIVAKWDEKGNLIRE